MPHYYNKEKKYWEASFYIKVNGKRKQIHRRGFDSAKAAKEFEREHINKYNNSTEMSFKSLYELQLENIEKRNKESYLTLKKSIFKNRVLPYFQNYKINEITPITINEWQNQLLSKKLSTAYLRTCDIHLNSLFNFGEKFFNIQNPMKKLDPICKADKKVKEIWSIEEFNIFHNSLKKEIHKIVFFTLFWTGMRVGEVLALTLKDLNFDNNYINIDKTLWKGKITAPKTKNSIRKIGMTKNLKKELEIYVGKLYKIGRDDRIFNISHGGISGPFRRRIENLGLKRIRIHDLRHGHASILISNNTNPVAVSKRLGHASVSITLNIYSHMLKEDEEKLIKKLDEL